jgi:hypothetical protein
MLRDNLAGGLISSRCGSAGESNYLAAFSFTLLPHRTNSPRMPQFSVGQRMTPPQTWETGVVAVRGDPVRASLNCKRSKIGITNEIALRARDLAQSREDFPVPFAWSNRDARRVFTKISHVLQGLGELGWLPENVGMSEYADNAAQDQVRHSHHRLATERLLEPRAKLQMIVRIKTLCVDQDVNVD